MSFKESGYRNFQRLKPVKVRVIVSVGKDASFCQISALEGYFLNFYTDAIRAISSVLRRLHCCQVIQISTSDQEE